MDKTLKHIIISLSIGLILGMLFCVGLRFCHKVDNGNSPKTVVERDTTIIVKNDTIVINNPIELEKTIVRYDTITKDTILTYEQKTYGDSNYVAYVSGYSPRLDSINIFCKDTTRTITITNEVEKKQSWASKHLGWGITLGGGYGLVNQRFDLFVGVGGILRF
jgi:hypothetical protein